jgi:hydrogenase expression/formation protein HypC
VSGGAGAAAGAAGAAAGAAQPGFGACSGEAGGDGECLTCGDVAIPLTVVEVAGADARCRDEAGRTETVAVELVGPVGVGDRLLVHAGVAIEVLRPETLRPAVLRPELPSPETLPPEMPPPEPES